MKFVPVKTPWIFRKLFPQFIWSVKTEEKVVYLTFDDGPTPQVTDFVLATLKKFEAKATFFCIGNNVEQHPEIFNQILEQGHSIGNHTQNHLKGWKTNTETYMQNVKEAEEIIQGLKFKAQGSLKSNLPANQDNSKSQSLNSKYDLSNKKSQIAIHQSTIPNLFRPPYGRIKRSQGKQLLQLGYKIIMWDVISFDWEKELSEEKCFKNVISKTEAGSIVVFHDSVKASKNMMYALPKVLGYFSEKGFQFESLK